MKPTGGGAQVTPVPPPASLFPGLTGGINNAPGLGNTLATTLQNITSGTDMNKLFSQITQSQQQSVTQGTAALKESFAASGLGGSTDMAQAITGYRQQAGAQLQSQLGQLGMQEQEIQLGGAQMLTSLASSFAPTSVVTQAPSGPSIFSQTASAGESAMMLFLMAAASG